MIAPAKPIRCAIYCRKSIEKGLDQDFNSIDAQREACAAYIQSQKASGWVHAETFEDGGFSGGNTERPAWKRLAAAVESGDIDLIVVTRADRLTRSLRDFVEILDFLDKHDASFVSVSESFDTSSPSGRAFLHMLMTFAQWERETIAERTRDKVAAARRKGRWTGGRLVLGYDLDGGRLVVNERERLIVQGLFDLFLEHGSLRLAAKAANERGWTLKRWTNRRGTTSGGGRFTKTSLHGLLTNVLYTGCVRSNGDTVDGEHDAIIDPAVFEEVGRRLRGNAHKRASASRTRDSQSWLRGLIHCAACDAPMSPTYTTKRNVRYRYYQCRRTVTEGWRSCPVKSVAAADVEAAVLAEVAASIRGDADLLQTTIREVHRQRRDRISELKREIRIAELERESANGNAGEVTRRLTKLTTELAALSADRIPATDVAQALQDFEPLWEALTYRAQAEVGRLIIERVVYDGASVEITLRGDSDGG